MPIVTPEGLATLVDRRFALEHSRIYAETLLGLEANPRIKAALEGEINRLLVDRIDHLVGRAIHDQSPHVDLQYDTSALSQALETFSSKNFTPQERTGLGLAGKRMRLVAEVLVAQAGFPIVGGVIQHRHSVRSPDLRSRSRGRRMRAGPPQLEGRGSSSAPAPRGSRELPLANPARALPGEEGGGSGPSEEVPTSDDPASDPGTSIVVDDPEAEARLSDEPVEQAMVDFLVPPPPMLEAGQLHSNPKGTVRKILSIEEGIVSYRIESSRARSAVGKEGTCSLDQFVDWIAGA